MECQVDREGEQAQSLGPLRKILYKGSVNSSSCLWATLLYPSGGGGPFIHPLKPSWLYNLPGPVACVKAMLCDFQDRCSEALQFLFPSHWKSAATYRCVG